MDAPLTRAEVAALLALAQDHAFAQPAGSQLRATVLGQRLAAAAGSDDAERAATWWTSALRFLGCTGHAYDMAVVFGDEIEMRSESMRLDFANPFDMMRLMVTHAGPLVAGGIVTVPDAGVKLVGPLTLQPAPAGSPAIDQV